MNPQDIEKVTAALQALEIKFSQLTNLMAFLVAETQEGLANKAVVLRRLGIGQKQIAEVCGTTTKTISVRLAESRRAQKKNRKER
jgi:hypothetical protein